MRERMRRAVVAAAVGVASLGVLGGTAAAEPAASWYKAQESWDDPKAKGGVALYEQATIWDYHPNGQRALAKLWVGGSGPAVFHSDGDGTTRRLNLSYDEDQTVYLEVCTSTSPDAVCTNRIAKGRS